MKIKTLEEALKRIKELEKENASLKAENEMLKERKTGGRKKHDIMISRPNTGAG